MQTGPEILAVLRAHKDVLQQRFSARRIGLFGSCARGGARPDSDVDILVDLERRMKCGVGKCGHCQINNIYVCQEGPVFNYGKIRDLKEAIR